MFPSAAQYLPLLTLAFSLSNHQNGEKQKTKIEEKGERGGIKLQMTWPTLILSTAQKAKI